MSWKRGMMVFKRVTSKKTNTGYSILVFMEDGRHVKPLLACIDRYFAWVAEYEEPGLKQRRLKEVNDVTRKIKVCAPIKDAH